jgi:hypothetical protein
VSRRPSPPAGRTAAAPLAALTLAAALALLGLALADPGVAAPAGEADGPHRIRPEAAGERPVGLLRGRAAAPQQARLLEGGTPHPLPAMLAHAAPGLLPGGVPPTTGATPDRAAAQAGPDRLAWRGGEAGTSRAPPRPTRV